MKHLTLNSLENVRAGAQGREPHRQQRQVGKWAQTQSMGVTRQGPQPTPVRPAHRLSRWVRAWPALGYAARQPWPGDPTRFQEVLILRGPLSGGRHLLPLGTGSRDSDCPSEEVPVNLAQMML